MALRNVLLQINLLGHDEVVPHNQDPDSQAYQSQKERLERNEFFKDCLAPQRAVLKVSTIIPCHFQHAQERAIPM